MVAVIDLGLTATIAFVWVIVLRVGDARLSVPILLARSAVSIAAVARLLQPLRRFTALRLSGQEVEDEALFAADAVLQRVIRQASTVMVIAWALALALTLLPAFGLILDHPVARAELMAAVMLALAVMMTVPIIFLNPLRMTLHPMLVEVSTTILERGLAMRRPPHSAARELTILYIVTIIVCFLPGFGVVTLMRAQSLREQTLSEQRRLVEVAVARGELRPGSAVQIVGIDELPAALELPAELEVGVSVGSFDPRRELASAAAPFGDGRWALAEAETDEQLGLMLGLIVAFFVIGLVPSGLNAISVGRASVQSIEELEASTRELVEAGRLARIARVVPLRNDEVGTLALTFNAMLDALDEFSLAAQQVAKGDLHAEIERQGDLPDAFRAMLGRLQLMVGKLRSTTLELGTAAEELLVSTETQAVAAQQQAASIAALSSTTRSLARSSATISDAADAARDNAERSVLTASETATKIEELDGQTHSIRELLELIHEIADRSDLLALNGSLEAVRAGESGRGFALVAAEMRRLAERVGHATQSIGQRVASIEGAASSSVEAMGRSRDLAAHTASAAREISEVIAGQTDKTQEAAAVADQAAAAVASFAAASEQTRATAISLQVQAEELERLSQEFEA